MENGTFGTRIQNSVGRIPRFRADSSAVRDRGSNGDFP